MSNQAIIDLVLGNVTRELILAAEESLLAGARRAFYMSIHAAPGHLAHVRGTLRHFR